jgi:hypothetical protein
MTSTAQNGISPHRIADFNLLATEVAFLRTKLRQLDDRQWSLSRILSGIEAERNEISAKLTQAKETLKSLTA